MQQLTAATQPQQHKGNCRCRKKTTAAADAATTTATAAIHGSSAAKGIGKGMGRGQLSKEAAAAAAAAAGRQQSLLVAAAAAAGAAAAGAAAAGSAAVGGEGDVVVSLYETAVQQRQRFSWADAPVGQFYEVESDDVKGCVWLRLCNVITWHNWADKLR